MNTIIYKVRIIKTTNLHYSIHLNIKIQIKLKKQEELVESILLYPLARYVYYMREIVELKMNKYNLRLVNM